MAKSKSLLIHLGILVLLCAAAIALATWRGGLWPFELRYSVLVAGAGLVLLVHGWGLVWLAPVVLAALVRPLSARIALWPLGVLGFVALHWAFGPGRGFAPLNALTFFGGVILYLAPVALALVVGSAVGTVARKTS
ncbi:hypothetical protein [Pseudorhodobacter aquimaris]|uniref:hypothetical protein n=1 Tax=Pseudorhodobacter aquimaris TaxID=687412 RepID=UPI00067B614D|nr:hypothetical protein [Pseudorhodobacter aquimaris]